MIEFLKERPIIDQLGDCYGSDAPSHFEMMEKINEIIEVVNNLQEHLNKTIETINGTDEIRNKAYELGQKYFPDANNVWARANIEAQYVSSACTEMAEWMQKKMIDKACEWIIANMPNYVNFEDGLLYEVDMADDFRKAMED